MSEKFTQPVIDITNNSLAKGEVRDGKQLIAWDCIQECHVHDCPIREKCSYKAVRQDGKCQLQVEYLDSLTTMVFSVYRYMNDDVLFKVGMHLVPLYSQLCRQKIVEKSVVNLAYEDAKGVTRIHPIYKEIRETMKTITMIWKEMGFNPPNIPLPTGADGQLAARSGFGDPNHYETISANADNKRDVIR